MTSENTQDGGEQGVPPDRTMGPLTTEETGR